MTSILDEMPTSTSYKYVHDIHADLNDHIIGQGYKNIIKMLKIYEQTTHVSLHICNQFKTAPNMCVFLTCMVI